MRKTHAVAAARLMVVGIAVAGALQPLVPGSRAEPAANDESRNLIVNGSFETGPEFEDNFLPIDEDSVAIRGWVVTRGQIDLLQQAGEQQKAAHGSRCLDLHGSPGWGGVEQPFVTKVGQRYKVAFRMSGNPGLGYLSVQLAVRAVGKKEVFECSMEGKSLDDLKWETKTWEFTAVDTITVLEFRTAMTTENPFGGPLLDDVQVVAVD
jgi:choice-of-anchor C domain-containing protein